MDLIIGAGITGLSYAAFTNNDYVIVEKESQYGGYCQTIVQDGFTWDYSGHFFHFKNDQVKKFIFERIRSQTIYDVKKRTTIYHDGNYIDFPFQKNIHQLPIDDFIDCLYGLATASNEKAETFKGMLKNSYGEGISNRFLIPYNEKLYACDLDSLDAEAMGRFFPHADLKSIIKNFKDDTTESYNDNFLYPKGGAIEYVHAIAKEVDLTKIRYNATVTSIDLKRRIAQLSSGERISFQRIISTIPFPKLLSIANQPHQSDVFKSNKVAVFNLGFDTPSSNSEHWIYYPDREIIFYRIGFYNNIFGSDQMSLYVEMGFPENATIDNEHVLLDRVMEDLCSVKVITNQKLISHKFIVMNPAYVHINTRANMEFLRLKNELESKNVFTAGRYGAWRYCSIEDNIIEARDLAEKLRA